MVRQAPAFSLLIVALLVRHRLHAHAAPPFTRMLGALAHYCKSSHLSSAQCCIRFLVVSRATSGVSRSSLSAVQLLRAITYQVGQLVRPVLVAPLIDLFEQLERCPSTQLSVILTATSRTLQVATGAAPALATGDKVTNVVCSAGLVAVKLGKGILCMTGAGDADVSVITCGLPLKSVGCQTWLFRLSLKRTLAFRGCHRTSSPLELFYRILTHFVHFTATCAACCTESALNGLLHV